MSQTDDESTQRQGNVAVASEYRRNDRQDWS